MLMSTLLANAIVNSILCLVLFGILVGITFLLLDKLKKKPKQFKAINSYDIDGVIFLGKGIKGIYPYDDDIIITGRSFEERPETDAMLKDLGIENIVYYNELPFSKKTRTTSGKHKATILTMLHNIGAVVQCHFEDDPLQAEVVRYECPWVHVILITHDLIEKNNVRRPWTSWVNCSFEVGAVGSTEISSVAVGANGSAGPR